MSSLGGELTLGPSGSLEARLDVGGAVIVVTLLDVMTGLLSIDRKLGATARVVLRVLHALTPSPRRALALEARLTLLAFFAIRAIRLMSIHPRLADVGVRLLKVQPATLTVRGGLVEVEQRLLKIELALSELSLRFPAGGHVPPWRVNWGAADPCPFWATTAVR